jgi:hypothetical protein
MTVATSSHQPAGAIAPNGHRTIYSSRDRHILSSF